MMSGCQGTPYFQEIRPGAGFKAGNFVEEKLRGLPQNDSPDKADFISNDCPSI